MARNPAALQQAQQAAWSRVKARIATIREEEVTSRMNRGMAQDIIDECLRFLYEERRYEAARDFLAMLIELDRANYAIQHPERALADDTPDYIRTEA